MDKALLAHLTDAERLLFHETDAAALAALDEDAVAELHNRIRRARNKYTGLYRREAAAAVPQRGGRGAARPFNTKNRARAEVFEEALARVSRRLGALARESASRLRAERLEAARAERSSGPSASAAPAVPKQAGRARVHEKTTGGVKRDASSRAAGARRQAARDAR